MGYNQQNISDGNRDFKSAVFAVFIGENAREKSVHTPACYVTCHANVTRSCISSDDGIEPP